MSEHADRLDEALLVLRCQTGDEAAFVELIARYGQRLRYFVRKRLGRDDAVDDVLQEVWIDVLRQLPRLNGGGPRKDRRIWRFGQPNVLHAHHIQARHAANEPPKDVTVEVLIGQNPDHGAGLSYGHGPTVPPCRRQSCPRPPAFRALLRLSDRRHRGSHRWEMDSQGSS